MYSACDREYDVCMVLCPIVCEVYEYNKGIPFWYGSAGIPYPQSRQTDPFLFKEAVSRDF